MFESSGRDSRRSLFATVIAPIAFVVVTIFFAVSFVLQFAARGSDEDALRRETVQVSNWLDRTVASIVWEQQSVTVWDETIEKLRDGDLEWLDANPGVWMHDYFGIDRVYILDDQDRPVYAMAEGRRTAPGANTDERMLLADLVREVRAAGAEEPDGVHGVMSLNGRAAIVGASLVVTDSGRLFQVPGTEYVHLAVRYIDQGLLDELAADAQIDAPRFWQGAGALAGEGSYPLTDRGGRIIGRFVWTADQPGARLLQRTLPMLGTAGFLMCAIAWLLARRLVRTTTALRASEADARHIAFHDGLTGLSNRHRFNIELAAAIDRVREGERVALVYVDLDRFKYVNDTFGHHAGDALIRSLAGRLKSIVRSSDVVARLGGDEFAIIQRDVLEDDDVRALCERVLGCVGEPFDVGGNDTYIGASLGVAIAPDQGIDATELTRKADIALYSAKAAGRNRVRLFAPEMDYALRRRQAVEQDLRRALENGVELSVAFQPVVECRGLTLVGMEALVRWNHPERGPVTPEEFIPVAEETGLIVPLGDLVMRQALRTAASIKDLTISINVSPVQILTSSFADRVLALVREAGVDPRRVELEITETVLLDGHDRSLPVLAALRAAGIHIALDDFGTGYSSLSYLRTFPIDRIKIDRSFVKTLATDRPTAEIVGAIVSLGHTLGKQVTAEGVESEAQFAILADAGCHAFQGHLFSPPVSAATMVAFAEGRALPATGIRARLTRGAA